MLPGVPFICPPVKYVQWPVDNNSHLEHGSKIEYKYWVRADIKMITSIYNQISAGKCGLFEEWQGGLYQFVFQLTT